MPEVLIADFEDVDSAPESGEQLIAGDIRHDLTAVRSRILGQTPAELDWHDRRCGLTGEHGHG